MSLSEQLRSAIFSGQYPPGSILSQTELAKVYGVSRIPIRDALQRLAADKVLEIVPGKGARIPTLNTAEVDEIYELRIMLECDLLARAISRADADCHAEVQYVLQKSSLEAGRSGWQAGDWHFHKTLYVPADRPRQIAVVEELRTSCVLYASHYDGLASQTDRWVAEHSTLCALFVGGHTKEACAALRQHIISARDCLSNR